MMNASATVPDPRLFPGARQALPRAAALYRLAEESLGAETGGQTDALDARLRDALLVELAGDGVTLAAIFAGAPSISVARHLWRQLDAAWHVAAGRDGAGLAVTVFALPLVVVVGRQATRGEGLLPAILSAPANLEAILREHGALAGNQTFALGNALTAVDAIDLARLPAILTWQRLPDSQASDATLPGRALAPAPLEVTAGSERVHLRFLVGSAIAKPGVDLLADMSVGRWGIPFAQELSRQLGAPDTSVLALPRAPQNPLSAVWQGRVAQREVAAQLFASNAIRKLRGLVGEPSAVISAHRTDAALQGGELRLSLSSPFEPRDAEGFRCPLYPQDRVGDVVTTLMDLLRDCRVADIRAIGGVHPDRDAATGLPLLFKPETIPPSVATIAH